MSFIFSEITMEIEQNTRVIPAPAPLKRPAVPSALPVSKPQGKRCQQTAWLEMGSGEN